MARVIAKAISDTIQNRLQDPRIEGIISVTDVKVPPDLKTAEIFLSIMAPSEKVRKRTFIAIQHATGHIRTLLSQQMVTRYCPELRFYEDERLKKTMETINIITELTKERNDEQDQDDS